eukprot:scaffold10228_cov26-Tisochrysis_lutea.AAC.1
MLVLSRLPGTSSAPAGVLACRAAEEDEPLASGVAARCGAPAERSGIRSALAFARPLSPHRRPL